MDTEAETPILWPPDAKNWLTGKDPDAGKDWRQEENTTTGRWDGWMSSPNQWTWVSASSGSWRWTGRPGVPQSMGLQRVDTTEQLNEDSNYFHPPPSVTIVYTQQYHSHHVLDSREHRNSSPFLRLKSLKLDTRILAISHFPSFLSTW